MHCRAKTSPSQNATALELYDRSKSVKLFLRGPLERQCQSASSLSGKSSIRRRGLAEIALHRHVRSAFKLDQPNRPDEKRKNRCTIAALSKPRLREFRLPMSILLGM